LVVAVIRAVAVNRFRQTGRPLGLGHMISAHLFANAWRPPISEHSRNQLS
jgi:hypothetical protein